MLLGHRSTSSGMPTEAELANRANIGPEASADLGRTDHFEQLRLVRVGDGNTSPELFAERDCRFNVNPAADLYFYFSVDNDFASTLARCVDATITVEYHDRDGNVPIGLQYDGMRGAYTAHPKVITTRGSGEWRTVRFNLADGYFGHRQNGGADFRVAVGANAQIHIDRVWLTLPETQPGPVLDSFSVSFNDGLVPEGTTLLGDAVVEPTGGVNNSGCVKLTKNFNAQHGSLIVDDFAGGLRVNGFSASFKVLVGGGTAVPADGFSFNFACDLPSTPFGEEGAGSGLTVSFDSFDNGGGEAPAIDLKWGSEVISHRLTPVSQGPVGADFVDVVIELDPDGTLDLTYDRLVLFEDFQTPWTPVGGMRFGFGARTGAHNDNHWVDDIAILTFFAPVISTQPQNQTVTAGATVNFWVEASGTAPLSYQWEFNGANIAGATGPTLTLNNVQAANAGSYRVIVSNFAGSVTSATATLTVNPPPQPPSISQQPQSQTVTAGSSVSFTVVASGTALLSYQWQFSGVNIEGAIDATLTLNNVQAANAGSYVVIVSNVAGMKISLPAFLTVNTPVVPPTITHHTVDTYQAGSTLFVTNRFQFVGQLDSLLWRPLLPNGWMLSVVSGDGDPRISRGEILLAASKLLSPIEIVYAVEIPANENNSKELRAEVDYQFASDPNLMTGRADPDPLRISTKLEVKINLIGNKAEISWSGDAMLQTADEVSGPWVDVIGARSPFKVITSRPEKFYRLKR